MRIVLILLTNYIIAGCTKEEDNQPPKLISSVPGMGDALTLDELPNLR
jgi:hypothetical protein